MEEKVVKIKQNLKASQDRKKSYVDKGRIHREFKVGDHMFLKVKVELSNRAGKGIVDLLRSRGCNLGARGCYAHIVPISFLILLKF
jgi:hypothetical protein